MWDGASYVPQSTSRLVWDGNVLVAILDQTNGLAIAFERAPNLSRGLQTGSAVAVNTRTNNVQFCAYDGDGNLMAMVAAAGGNLSATYDYDQFTKPLKAAGASAKANPLRFNGQLVDDLKGNVRYLYRELQPSSAKWLTRDPMAEASFTNGQPAFVVPAGQYLQLLLNPYCFGFNRGSQAIDALGLFCIDYSPGVNFIGFADEDLLNFRIINEDNTLGGAPSPGHGLYRPVDGFWYRWNNLEWFKIPGYCRVNVTATPNGDFTTDYCCDTCLRLARMVQLQHAGCTLGWDPGFVPDSGCTWHETDYPWGP
jgi:RHS repeat-associated protein